MQNPRFTFCIPNLNKIEYLPACIESLLAQDCSDWRCIFVDGYSTDGSWEYIQQFASDPRFLILRGLKQGMYADWNECLRHVKTEYFYFLTSDDTCYPALISKTTNILDAHPDVDACHFKFALIDSTGAIIRSPEEITQESFDFYVDINQHIHKRSGICEFFMHFVYDTIYRTITSLVFRSRLIPKIGGFSSQYGSAGDFDWTMRLGLLTDVLYIPELLATWRIYEGQATQNLHSSLHRRRTLNLARSNLSLLKANGLHKLKSSTLNQRGLLLNFNDGYATSLRREMLSSKSLLNAFASLYTLLTNCPSYPLRKIINRLSQDRLFRYHGDKFAFAQSLINEYGLQCPLQL